MKQLKKMTLLLAPLMFLCLIPALSAQDTMAKGDKMAKMSATGCLMKGTTPDGYYLKGDDGKTYELWGSKSLGAHVNHKVTVSGMEEKMPEPKEKTKETMEKSEAGGQPQMDLKVTKVKMVSDSCS